MHTQIARTKTDALKSIEVSIVDMIILPLGLGGLTRQSDSQSY